MVLHFCLLFVDEERVHCKMVPPKPDATMVLLGAHRAGRSSLVGRLMNDRFPRDSSFSIGAAFVDFPVGSRQLRMWICRGAERYPLLPRSLLSGIDLLAMVIDFNDPQVAVFRHHCRQHLPTGAPWILIITKLDLAASDREHRDAFLGDSLLSIAADHNCPPPVKTVFVSSKSGEGIEELRDFLRTVALGAMGSDIHRSGSVRLPPSHSTIKMRPPAARQIWCSC